MQIKNLHKLFLDSGKVIIDSRKAEKGSLFFGLKGENVDGNKYASNAIENGCSYAIIDKPEYYKSDKYILVEDVLKTLQDLAVYHRQQFKIPIIAITGTNGKTTTKELIAAVLDNKFDVCYTKGNLNNHIGLPLTLLEMNESTQIGVIEMGANHMKEIKFLCEIARPDYGIITNIGKAHLEGFGSFENVIKTKKELYEYIKKHNGKVFYNQKNKLLKSLVHELCIDSIPFGGETSIIKGDLLPADKFLSLELSINDSKHIVSTKLIGSYNLENVLAAVSIGTFFGIEATLIIEAIENYTPNNNRSQYLQTEKNNLLLDAYNANPTSVTAAIQNFHSLKIENKCLILGDMLELGSNAKKEHQRILGLVSELGFNKVILVGPIYASLDLPPYVYDFFNVEDLKKWLLKNEITNSNVLIKGSRGIRLEQITDYL